MACKYSNICELYVSKNASCNPAEGEKPYCGEFRKFESLEEAPAGRWVLNKMKKGLETGCASENL